MLFTDAVFLFYFLPAALILHRLSLARGRKDGSGYPTVAKFTFFALTLVFYGYRETWWLAPFLLSVALDFLWARLLTTVCTRPWARKAALTASIVQNLSFLALFKYRSFLRVSFGLPLPELTQSGTSLILPAGISFYTFESLSFVIDVYRRKVALPLKASNFFPFIGMFPRFIAGPITRYPDIAGQLEDYAGMDVERGLIVFCWGLFLKVAFADQCALLVPYAFGGAGPSGFVTAWLGVIAFTLQIYFDFSGYSLMAIGLGRCFGFRFPQNFDRPFLAESLADLWMRWHRTLTLWFRDYLYIPLGGNRCGKPRAVFNVFLTFCLAGLWHGASWTFVIWGAWHALCLCVERTRVFSILKPRGLARPWVLGVWLIGSVIFRAESPGQARQVYRALFSWGDGSYDWEVVRVHAIGSALALGALLYCFGFEGQMNDALERIEVHDLNWKIAAAAMLLVSLTLAFSSTHIPFLYFRF